MCSFQCQLEVIPWDYCHEHCCDIEKPRLLLCHKNCCKNTYTRCRTCTWKHHRFCKVWINLYDSYYYSYRSQKGTFARSKVAKHYSANSFVWLTNRIVVSVCTCHQSNLQSTGLISAFCMIRSPQFVRIHTKSGFESARMTWIEHRLKENDRNGRKLYGNDTGLESVSSEIEKMISSLHDKETYRYCNVSLQ